MTLYRTVVAVLALLFVGIGIALLAVTAANGGGVLGFLLGALFIAPRRRAADAAPEGRPLVARKLRGFQRVLDAPALFSIAYGEIASSIYFALGIVAGYALGFTPLVLLVAGSRLPDRRALLRRRDGRDPRDRRRGDVRPPGLQRPVRLPHRLGAVPGLPDRDRALGALPAALPRNRARRGRPARLAVGCGDRRLRDRRDRRHPARAALRAPHRRDRSRRARPCDAAPARDPGARTALLTGSPDPGNVARDRTRVVGHRLRAAARDARLHRARDGRQPRRGDPRAWTHPAPQPLLRDRARRRVDGADRRRRALRLPGRERADRACRGVAEGAPRGDRRRAPGVAARLARRRAARLRRPDRCARSPGGGDDLDLRLHEARVLARRAPPAAAKLRPAEPAHARLAAGDRGCGGDLDRARRSSPARSPTMSSSWPASTRSGCCSRSPRRSLRCSGCA